MMEVEKYDVDHVEAVKLLNWYQAELAKTRTQCTALEAKNAEMEGVVREFAEAVQFGCLLVDCIHGGCFCVHCQARGIKGPDVKHADTCITVKDSEWLERRKR